MPPLAVACRPRLTPVTARRARARSARGVASSNPSCAPASSAIRQSSLQCRPRVGPRISVTPETRRCRSSVRRVRAVSPAAVFASGDAAVTETENHPILGQILAGITVSLAMVPESLAFTFVAGVSPIVGLHAAALMGLCTAVFGAQPGVISGAAGATAVVFAPLVASHGVEYLFAAVLLAGAIQVRSVFHPNTVCRWSARNYSLTRSERR